MYSTPVAPPTGFLPVVEQNQVSPKSRTYLRTGSYDRYIVLVLAGCQSLPGLADASNARLGLQNPPSAGTSFPQCAERCDTFEPIAV